jgi:hypothetical protein
MKNVVLSAIVGSVVCLAAAPAIAQSIGKTIKADRTVSGSKSGVLKINSNVVANERISANTTGLGHIEFNDGTKMVVGPNTNLVLDRAVFNPGQSSFRKLAMDSTAGALRFISGSSAKGTYEIQTPTGTLGIRGTAFDMQHYRGRTYIMLVSGEVTFCTNSGECETITRKCDYVVASPDGSITPPVQPRRGIFQGRDMEIYFPFINDQSQIEPEFQLGISRCGGGASFAGVNQPGNGDNPARGDGGYDGETE